MRPIRLLSLLAAAALAACGDAPTSTATPELAIPAPRHTLSSATPLYVSMNGPTKMLQEGAANYSATVTGGSGSYWYQWISEVCYEGGYCREPNVFAVGEGVSAATLLVPAEFYWVRVSVQVHETSDVQMSGVGYRSMLGPATTGQSPTYNNWLCRKPTSFPHKEHEFTNGQWVPGKNYARDCTGTRIYAP